MLDCPHDKIIFDVGHQAYAHKLVTGRLDDVRYAAHLRRPVRVSRSPTRAPTTCIRRVMPPTRCRWRSAWRRRANSRAATSKIVAVIGDAALSGGMAFEALNHIGQAQTPMVIILNDNEMSISRNVGALMKHLGYMRASPSVSPDARLACRRRSRAAGAFGSALANFGRNMKESMKQFVHSALHDLRAAGHPVHGAHRRSRHRRCSRRRSPS